MSLKFTGIGFCEITRPPEERSDKRETAEVYAADVAEFVNPAGVVVVVDLHIATHDEAGERKRHERAVQDSVSESSRAILRIGPGHCPTVKQSEYGNDDNECRRLAHNHLREAAWLRDRGLYRIHI